MSNQPLSPTDDLDNPAPPDEVSTFLNRFFEFARPIADACREPGLDMQLSDSAGFFALVDALERLGYDGIEQTLLVFLDEFSHLEQRSYDELYLWSIVELSRRSLDHVDTFWPMALTLDLRFRSAPWKRQASAVEQPYRFTELLMYSYVASTLAPQRAADDFRENGHSIRRYPPLATCLRRIHRQLTAEQAALLMDTLRELSRQERQPAYGDAHGLLLRGK